jgi:hypothetical protein
MSTISMKMAKDILGRLNKSNEKVRCYENLNIDKNRWLFILTELGKKYHILYTANLSEKENGGWKWSFSSENSLSVETDYNPISEPLNINEIKFVMGKKEIVDDFETLVKGGTIL